MTVNWVSSTQDKIFTIVKTRAKAHLVKKYPNIEFTTEDQDTSYTKFPTVHIHFLPSSEMGSTLDGIGINAFICGVQINVTTSKEQGQKGATDVMDEVLENFDILRFRTLEIPEFGRTGNSDTRVKTARVQRVIGYDDLIN